MREGICLTFLQCVFLLQMSPRIENLKVCGGGGQRRRRGGGEDEGGDPGQEWNSSS